MWKESLWDQCNYAIGSINTSLYFQQSRLLCKCNFFLLRENHDFRHWKKMYINVFVFYFYGKNCGTSVKKMWVIQGFHVRRAPKEAGLDYAFTLKAKWTHIRYYSEPIYTSKCKVLSVTAWWIVLVVSHLLILPLKLSKSLHSTRSWLCFRKTILSFLSSFF